MHCITVHTAYGGTLFILYMKALRYMKDPDYTHSHTAHNVPTHTAHNVTTHTVHNVPTHTAHNVPTHTAHNVPTHTAHNVPTHTAHNVPSHTALNYPLHGGMKYEESDHSYSYHNQSLPLLFVSRIKGCFVYMHTNVLQTFSTLCSFLHLLSCTK